MKVAILSLLLLSFTTITAQPTVITDPASGAQVIPWIEGFDASHCKWSGSIKNGYAHGKGTLIVYHDKKIIYTLKGNLNLGKIDGFASISTELMEYSCVFVNNVLNGQGKIIFKNGAIYEGEFRNDALYQGKFTKIISDSTKIEYNILNEKKEGIASFYLYDKKYVQYLFNADTLLSTDHRNMLRYKRKDLPALTVNVSDNNVIFQEVRLFIDSNIVFRGDELYDGFKFSSPSKGHLCWSMSDFDGISSWFLIYATKDGPDGALSGGRLTGKRFVQLSAELKENTEYIMWFGMQRDNNRIIKEGIKFSVSLNIVSAAARSKDLETLFK